jgi:hypothetical protein
LTREKEFYSLSSSAVYYARVQLLFDVAIRRSFNFPAQVYVMIRKIVLLSAAFSLWGCATVATQSSLSPAGGKSAENIVSARAEARWDAMIAHDLDRAYEFLSPGSKTANSLEAFRAKIKPLDWRSAKAMSASCDNEKCSVQMQIVFKDPRFGGANTVLVETWIRDSGNWWYVFNG